MTAPKDEVALGPVRNFMAFDLEPKRVNASRKMGLPVFYGDGASPPHLRRRFEEARGTCRALPKTARCVQRTTSKGRQPPRAGFNSCSSPPLLHTTPLWLPLCLSH
jgi:hypothetical protein